MLSRKMGSLHALASAIGKPLEASGGRDKKGVGAPEILVDGEAGEGLL